MYSVLVYFLNKICQFVPKKLYSKYISNYLDLVVLKNQQQSLEFQQLLKIVFLSIRLIKKQNFNKTKLY